MAYKIGRILQLVGLLITPSGISGNLVRSDIVDVKMSLAIATVGIFIFFVGWLVQQAGKSS
jgi:hypothetical protein